MFRNALTKSPHDAVILSAARTPIGRIFTGSFRETYPEEFLIPTLQSAITRAHIPPSAVNSICIGNVNCELGFSRTGRAAINLAGFPNETAFHVVNRQECSSLQAITDIAHAIMVGQIEVGVAGGTESMTRGYYPKKMRPRDTSPMFRRGEVQSARDCFMQMKQTSEVVASRYKVRRSEQDEFALMSYRRAQRAAKKEWFEEEIVPVHARRRDAETGEETWEWVTRDDRIPRGRIDREAIVQDKPITGRKGKATTTSMNLGPVSDGASALVLASRAWAEAHGIKPIARFGGTQVTGCAPDEMGVGPIEAIRNLYKHTRISKKDVDIFEINEVFASGALHTIKTLGLELEKVNPNGGAIALGNPIGAAGARQTTTLLAELKRQGKELGIVSSCAMTGMGMASLFIRE